MMKIKRCFSRYREIIVYLLVGFETTLIGWGAKYLYNWLFFNNTLFPTQTQNVILSTINWIAGVMFAYPANRVWVFKSKNSRIVREMTLFMISRLGTWFLDLLFIQLLSNGIGINLYISTAISAFVIVVLNWIISKKNVFVTVEKNNMNNTDGKDPSKAL